MTDLDEMPDQRGAVLGADCCAYPPFDIKDRLSRQDQALASLIRQPDVAHAVFFRRELHQAGPPEVPHDPLHRLTGHTVAPCQLPGMEDGCDGELLEDVELRGREVER